ncbi:hypothetical protein [Chryseobacterium sp. T1]
MKSNLIILTAYMLVTCNPINKKFMKVYRFTFSTQYNQFYLEDKGNNSDTVSFDFWNEDAFNERLALSNKIIGVGTQSYGNIKGEIEILEKPNTNIDYSKYDHIVEGGINIGSGELQILDSPNSHLELSLKVTPGKYKVRVYSSNLASVKEPDLPNDTDNDYYRIELWKSDEMERKVLKQYPSL